MDDGMRGGGGGDGGGGNENSGTSLFDQENFAFFRRNFDQSIHDPFEAFMGNEFSRLFQEVDGLMRHFTTQGGFPFIEAPEFNSPPSFPHKQQHPSLPDSSQNLRDKFLKETPPDITTKKENEPSSSSRFFSKQQQQRPFFERFFEPKQPSIKSADPAYEEDLDLKIQMEGFDKVMKEDLFKGHNHLSDLNKPMERPQSGFFNTGHSYSIRRVQRPDGSIEEVKTFRNSDGKEEITTTRIIGDKAHSMIEKKINNQVHETEEIFHNFDQENIHQFNQMWSHFPNHNNESTMRGIESNNKQFKSPVADYSQDSSSSSIVSKLFSWFKK